MGGGIVGIVVSAAERVGRLADIASVEEGGRKVALVLAVAGFQTDCGTKGQMAPSVSPIEFARCRVPSRRRPRSRAW